MNIQKWWHELWNPPVNGPEATVFIRLMTGGVFLWEGIMKFVYPNLGVGRFTKLGFPFPDMTAGFVAWVEIIGGILFIVGYLTRPVAIAFMIEMIVAMLSTKIGVYLGNSPLGQPPAMPKVGLGAVLHDIRSDYAQFMTSLFLLKAGPGPLSLDAKTSKTPNLAKTTRYAALVAVFCLVGGLARAAGSASPGMSAPASVVSAFDQGQAAIKKSDYKTAGQFFRQALQDQPTNPEVLNMLAYSERKQGHLEEAFEYYDKALALKPRFPEAREYLAEAHLQAALRELNTLKSYGSEGKDDAAEVVEAFQKAATSL